jgi:hypothetical protein
MLALLSLSSGLLPAQPPSGAVRSGAMPAPANTRRAALFAGSTAVLSMLPAAARADAIADIAARNNALAKEERENAESITQENENREILTLLAVSLVVFAGPITGIKGAEKAIEAASGNRGSDEELLANLKKGKKGGKGGKAAPPPRPAGKLFPWE